MSEADLGLTGAEGPSLEAFVRKAYLDYSMSVVRARALPEVADGLKPVHRRVLYASHRLAIGSTAKHRKVAMIVGETLGKYHPHGDQSVADALVRMGQDFSLRYPLIDGQGNFGSRDGDGAAAPRYIEARLTRFAELMLGEIDMDTVDFIPNYEGTTTEPDVLPARLPFVLLNGSSGVAVGYATEIPSHNLREVVAAVCRLIRSPESGLDEVLDVMPGPDFPCGGQIISTAEAIRSVYEKGNGSIRTRARWRREELARGQWQIVVYEMPHGTSTTTVLQEIESCVNPQVREGKKEVSPQQKNLKQAMLAVLETARDESCKAEPVRLVLEPKTARVSEDELMATLLASTSLECNVPVNMVVIGADRKPLQKPLVNILREWIDFRFFTVERRLKFRLGVIERRLHILEGRSAVLLHLDEVIKTIRVSEDPKQELMLKFSLTEVQAEDILEIRLRQLARLESLRIQQEITEIRGEIAGIRHLLTDPQAFRAHILGELEEDARIYGDDRRTLIQPVAPVRPAVVVVPDEAVTVLISKNGWVRARVGHRLDRASIGYKAGDAESLVIETRSSWPLVVLDTNGRAYTVKVSDLPIGGRGDGVLLTGLMELQAGSCGPGRVAHVVSDSPDQVYLFANSGGYGFACSLDKLVSRHRAGKAFMVTESGETVLQPAKVRGKDVVALSRDGRQVRLAIFDYGEVKVMGGGRGVQLMALGGSDELGDVSVFDAVSVALRDGGRRVALPDADLDRFRTRRARRGAIVALATTAATIER